MDRVKMTSHKDDLRIRESTVIKLNNQMNTNNYFFTQIEGIRFDTS
jgi:hypothetical protein